MSGESLVVFDLGGQPHALQATDVLKVIEMGPLVPIPRLATPLRGITHHRGRILTVVDLGLLINPGATPQDPAHARLVLVTHAGREVGLLTGPVRELVELDAASASPPVREGTMVVRLHKHRGEALAVLGTDRLLARIGKLGQPDYANAPRRPGGGAHPAGA